MEFEVYSVGQHVDFLEYGEIWHGTILKLIKVESDGSAYYRVKLDDSVCVTIVDTGMILAAEKAA